MPGDCRRSSRTTACQLAVPEDVGSFATGYRGYRAEAGSRREIGDVLNDRLREKSGVQALVDGKTQAVRAASRTRALPAGLGVQKAATEDYPVALCVLGRPTAPEERLVKHFPDVRPPAAVQPTTSIVGWRKAVGISLTEVVAFQSRKRRRKPAKACRGLEACFLCRAVRDFYRLGSVIFAKIVPSSA